jgi:parvulin-like peptidyl-prolyl isomerase
MITLNKSGGNDSNTLGLANEILAKIQKGESFHDLAVLHSQDAQRAAGGERDWIDRTTLNKDLTAAAFALKPGETSGVIDLPGACYLLNVMEARPAHVKPLSEVRDSIEKELRAGEQARLQNQWMAALKRKTFWQLYN